MLNIFILTFGLHISFLDCHYRLTMFTPLGLFKDVPCPQLQDCSLVTCMFSHKPTPRPEQTAAENTVVAPEPPVEPPSKRVKVERVPESKPQEAKPLADRARGETAVAGEANGKPQPSPSAKLHSTSRPVSPPPTRTGPPKSEVAGIKHEDSASNRPPPRRAPKERLNPRILPKAPAAHNIRLAILTKLHAAMSALNDKLKDETGSTRFLVLSPEELVTMALDEEEKVAKDSPSVYSNIIKLRIVKLSKMSQEDWLKEVKDHLNARYYKIESKEQPAPKVFTTGLSAKEEIAVAAKLMTPLDGLDQFGYVTRAPTEAEIEQARKGVLESKGWEKCDRCGGRFQVFPGRREDGSLTTGGQCTHHAAKLVYPPRKKTDRVTGAKDPYYSCCNEPVGTSAGCTTKETHVFKVSEAKRLASILQFKVTPADPDKGPQQPVCFDCEMGYTTQGLELIRLTAVSWPRGKELLDILVRPIGEILDLNSRFSGIFPEHYAKAVPYGTTDTAPTLEYGEVQTPRMQMVESPAAARDLLFQFLQPDTPLIGHAIDNDLNACRIIHPAIIDTVLLYPPPGGLPSRMALKTLSRKFLDRDIQMGGNRGHDSKEDSIATGDLVRVKAAEVWKRIKAKGWVVREGKLVAPPGAEDEDVGVLRHLGAGAGQKRKSAA